MRQIDDGRTDHPRGRTDDPDMDQRHAAGLADALHVFHAGGAERPVQKMIILIRERLRTAALQAGAAQ